MGPAPVPNFTPNWSPDNARESRPLLLLFPRPECHQCDLRETESQKEKDEMKKLL